MSDLKKWLEAVSNEDAEHQANIDTQPQLKNEEDVVTVGDDEKLTDDASKADADAEVKAEGSDTAVSVEEDTASELVEEAGLTDPIEDETVAEVEAGPTDDVDSTNEAEPVTVAEPAEVSVEEEKDESEAEEEPAPAEDEVEEAPVDETEVVEAPVEAPEAEASEVADEIVEQVEETTDTEVDETDPVVEDPEVEVPVDTVDDSVEPTAVDESGDAADPVETTTDSEEPILEVDPVAEIKEGEVPVEAETDVDSEDESETTVAEDEDSFEDFDSEADEGITDDMDGVEQDIDDMGNMQAALEAYGELLSVEMDRKNGVIDPTLVRAIQIGLESFGEPVLTEDVPSLEDFTDPSGRYVVSLEFAEGLKDKAGKVAQATAGALKRLWELLEDIFRQFKANVPALEQKNKEIEEKLKTVVDAGKGSVSMKGARRLYIGDMFAGNNPNNIRDVYKVGDKFMVLYPKMFREIVKDYKQFSKQIEGSGIVELDVIGFINSTVKHFTPADLGMQKIDVSKTPSSMQKYLTHVASPALLGNRRFFAGISMDVKGVESPGAIDNKQNNDLHITASLADIFKLEFGREQNVPDSGSDDIVKLPDVDTLRQLAKETTVLTKHLEGYTTATSSFRQIRQEMVSSIHSVALAVVAQGITRAITVPSGHFVGYVGNLVRVLQAFIEYCINEHQAAVTDV